MTRHRSGRLAKLFATGATILVASAAILPGIAAAADTRVLWIGAPDLSVDADANGTPDTNGQLFPTSVTVPAAPPAPQHLTLFDVQILNGDNQNLANTVLVITVADRAGMSINSIADPDGGTDVDDCTISANVITCDYQSLSAGAHRTVSVLVNVTSSYVTTSQLPGLFTARATTNNENGTNQQTFEATSGAFAVGAFNDNGLTTFVPEGTVAQFATTGTGVGGNLSTKVNFTAGAREVVRITEGTSSSLLYPCPAGLTCQNDFSEVVTESGEFADSPFFIWTISAKVSKTYVLSQGFVAHYPVGGTVPDWTLLLKSKSSFCGTDIPAKIASSGHCIKSATLSKPVGGVSNLEIVVVMDHQGGMKY